MRILISPLDWGLGHASRSEVVVKHLLKHNNEVIIAGSGDSLRMLQSQFPSLKTISLKSFSPWTPSWLPFSLAIAAQLPYFFFCIVREYFAVQGIVSRLNIELIISDNRYGLFSHKCHSAIITHQLSPIPWSNCPKWIRKTIAWGIARLLSKFNYCLIPDFPDHRLSGNLSTTTFPLRCRQFFIGPISRYAEYYDSSIAPSIACLGILTGPESSRLSYERELSTRRDIQQLSIDSHLVLIGGSNSLNFSAKEIALLIQQSEHIFSRSGYTTIMDLYCLNALSRASLSPTPDQAEQEYLASLLRQ